MKVHIIIMYEIITVLFPLIISMFFMLSIRKKQQIPFSIGYIVVILIYGIYFFGILHYTGAGTLYQMQMYGMEINFNEFNFIPFSQELDSIAYFLNIVLFIPLGFLLPFIWKSLNSWKLILFISAGTSVLIECSQIFNHRRTDIDDLLLNVLGGLVGYLIFKCFSKVTKCTNAEFQFNIEPIVYIVVMFLGHFFLFNEFGIASKLYNF